MQDKFSHVNLIDSGVEKKLIKIPGNWIYINKTKVGSANEDIFQRPQDQSQDPILLTHDTNHVMSTNVASNAINNAMSTNNTSDVMSTNEEPKQKIDAREISLKLIPVHKFQLTSAS